MTLRIFINGFGRIGRTITRIILTEHADIDIVGINDIAPLDSCAYLFGYDSVFGPFPGGVTGRDGALHAAGRKIAMTHAEDISALDLAGVDIVLECTGKAQTQMIAERGLIAGAERILISGPSPAAEDTIVLGANHDILADQKILSNASCTTNALAPLLRLLDEAAGVQSGHMTTVHCYTGSQPTVDAPRGDLVRSRAAALSMVPTTTSAGRLIGTVLPHLAGRIEARAIRVPTASVSAIDLTVQTRDPITAETLNGMIQSADPTLFGYTDLPLVSTDLRGRPESLIVAGRETSVSLGGVLRIFGWYDNEWGFSARMIDMARRMR
ncbi:glyceraldehyde 3-phosphate dehydrogenase NAD-binding domain-containing protein [Marinovum sp. 2_MG-2023]|uniref:type I glyceraldehyde-3-phosphate dehydrogenase n=1 Tax=unclassified Marinovum TaxID=2647166 RepID=UPI0026E18197|nr:MULTISPECIES: glyceraldehyde 3-phosphate dehydrogenase NAD-binding domain-containing protein [unclassified Marinovum]MDO6729367.1 glyceraldehyde 3-phosphate dehydrogenase NAD-binding domain-containing protein [Marinovum sp. 2_MG-2023]MDO6780417.1 glyceraldehyde 3-phosphate dehydrogenase NAD-binding domain-containing protein [Marinovum sp. 1_MG-2023]